MTRLTLHRVKPWVWEVIVTDGALRYGPITWFGPTFLVQWYGSRYALAVAKNKVVPQGQLTIVTDEEFEESQPSEWDL